VREDTAVYIHSFGFSILTTRQNEEGQGGKRLDGHADKDVQVETDILKKNHELNTNRINGFSALPVTIAMP
jgi:hypothetical protein